MVQRDIHLNINVALIVVKAEFGYESVVATKELTCNVCGKVFDTRDKEVVEKRIKFDAEKEKDVNEQE